MFTKLALVSVLLLATLAALSDMTTAEYFPAREVHEYEYGDIESRPRGPGPYPKRRGCSGSKCWKSPSGTRCSQDSQCQSGHCRQRIVAKTCD